MDPETIRTSIKNKKRYGSDLPSHYSTYKQAVVDNLLVRSNKFADSLLPVLIFILGFVALSYKASGNFAFIIMDALEIIIFYTFFCLLTGLLYKYKFWTRNKLNAICMFLLAVIIFYVMASPPVLLKF